MALLAGHRQRYTDLCAGLGFELPADGFMFSRDVDGSTHLKPATVGQRYSRLARRIGIKTTIHKLRHYSATELIAGGVDVRTVAGRLGHGGGGTTTLRVNAAWVSEADQRASRELLMRLPNRPSALQYQARPVLPTVAGSSSTLLRVRWIGEIFRLQRVAAAFAIGLVFKSRLKLDKFAQGKIGIVKQAHLFQFDSSLHHPWPRFGDFNSPRESAPVQKSFMHIGA